MFKIGDFSKLTQVSVKTLRWYDEIGLLKPSAVDDFTGYRYYSAHQMVRLCRILVFRDLGFTLAQISELLNENLPVEKIEGMLKLRHMQIEQQLADQKAQLSRIEARLDLIKEENFMSNHEIVLKNVEPITVACAQNVVPTWDDMEEYSGSLVREITQWLANHGLSPAHPWMSISKETEYVERDISFEMAVKIGPQSAKIATAVVENGKVKIQTLPDETVASTIHHGTYDTLWQAYVALGKWIETNGYEISGDSRVLFLEGGNDPTDPDYTSEVQYPVKKEID